MKLKDSLESEVSINRDGWLTRQMQTLTCAVKTWNALPRSKHDKSKVVYTLLMLYFGSEIWNLKLEIGKTHRGRCVT